MKRSVGRLTDRSWQRQWDVQPSLMGRPTEPHGTSNRGSWDVRWTVRGTSDRGSRHVRPRFTARTMVGSWEVRLSVHGTVHGTFAPWSGDLWVRLDERPATQLTLWERMYIARRKNQTCVATNRAHLLTTGRIMTDHSRPRSRPPNRWNSKISVCTE